MQLRDNKTKNPSFFTVIFILLTLVTLAAIAGCGGNNAVPDNYGDIIQAAAYIDPESIPTTEIISGTVSFEPPVPTNPTAPASQETTAAPGENTKADETTEPSESSEILEVSEPYVITPSGKKYHYPTCRTVNTIKQYISKEEAERLGYGPCGICKPE